MKTLRKTLKWLGLTLLGLVLVVGLCWWLIPDEKLNPEAEKFVAQPQVPPSKNNAYFMIWGLPASPELDPHGVGQKIVAAHDRLLAAQKSLKNFKADSYLGANPLTFPKDSQRICDVEKQNCLRIYQENRAVVESELEAKKVFVERYRKIRGYEEFSHAMSQVTVESPAPSWQPIMRMSDLVDGSIALRMLSKGTQEAALGELAADIGSWRRLLQANDWLITQMVSVAVLHRKYRLASEIMNAYPDVARSYPALMKIITLPIAVGNANIVPSVKHEARNTMQLFWDMGQEKRLVTTTLTKDRTPNEFIESALIRLSYQPNASINAAYATFNEVVTLLAKSPKEIVAGHEALLKSQADRNALGPGVIFYNFVGRLVLSFDFPDYSPYAFRMHDLLGLSRLIDLQRRIIEANIPAEKVVESLPAFGADLMDPYTEKPMQWDPATRNLSFTLHGKRYANFGVVQIAPVK
ncbi:MAG: hypothetical protein ABI790_08930 [Betaproteobacteria bacterium]